MKSHFLIKFKTDEVDENGFDIHNFRVTRYKYANVKVARKRLEKLLGVPLDETEVSLTPCSKDWGKIK